MKLGRRLVLLTCVALTGVGCGGPRAGYGGGKFAGTTITFSISVSDDERPAVQALLSRFQTETKARVDLQAIGRFRSQVGTRVNLVSSKSPDALVERLRADADRPAPSIQLFAQDNLALKELVEEGLVEDLSEVAIPGEVSPSMLPPKFGGSQYFLPFRPNVRLTYVDRQLFDQAGLAAPTTVEELKVAAERLKAATGRPQVTLSLARGDPAAVTLSEWIVSFGGDPLVLNDVGSRRAFQFLQDLWKEGLLARESLFAKFDTEVDNLESGAASLAQNWSVTSAELAKHDALDRFAVYPGWSGPGRAVHVVGGDVLGIPRGVTGRSKDAALALARFLMSQEAQEYLVEHNAWPSVRDDAYNHVPREQGATFAAIRVALKDGWFRPSVSYWPEVTQAMSEAVDRILLQYEPVGDVLDELHAKLATAALNRGAPYPPTS
jgi:trehalose transport system substrate-binding protein